jgi:hypothetical protein
MLGWIREKRLLKNQPQEVVIFLPLDQPPLEMAPQPVAACALQVEKLAMARALEVGTT